MSNLLLHCGSNEVTRDEVFAAPTPEGTDTHFPIPHGTLIETVERHVLSSGFEIQEEEYGLLRDGDQMFGVWTLGNGVAMEDYQLTIGLRNAHDKQFSAGMAVGSRVFVCDNLAFSAEIVIARKHTKYILRDLDKMVADASGRIAEARVAQDQRIGAYKSTELLDPEVHDFVIRSVDAQVIPNRDIAHVLGEWREPSHDEFAPRTAWSLFNAYTEVMKGTNPRDLTPRTRRLHGMMDALSDAFGIAAGAPDFESALEAYADPTEDGEAAPQELRDLRDTVADAMGILPEEVTL